MLTAVDCRENWFKPGEICEDANYEMTRA